MPPEPPASSPDRDAVLLALTTEHFTLQGARTATVSESAARSAVYMGALSSAVIALAFVGQLSRAGQVFHVFALIVLPTLFVLGHFTFRRLIESAVEDMTYGRAINRIRQYYLELAGEARRYFLLGAHDDWAGVRQNAGVRHSRTYLVFTAASMLAVVNCVVAGTAFALLVDAVAEPRLGFAIAPGATLALVLVILHLAYERREFRAAEQRFEILLPSPPRRERVP